MTKRDLSLQLPGLHGRLAALYRGPELLALSSAYDADSALRDFGAQGGPSAALRACAEAGRGCQVGDEFVTPEPDGTWQARQVVKLPAEHRPANTGGLTEARHRLVFLTPVSGDVRPLGAALPPRAQLLRHTRSGQWYIQSVGELLTLTPDPCRADAWLRGSGHFDDLHPSLRGHHQHIVEQYVQAGAAVTGRTTFSLSTFTPRRRAA